MLGSKVEENKKQQYTVIWANDLFFRIDNAVYEKIIVEKTDECGRVPPQTLSYISSNKTIERLVYTILNQYSALGRAVQDELVDFDQVLALRKKAVIDAWELYGNYIYEVRYKSPKAWQDF
ncbi:MAG: hypothetical protein AB2551_12360 [Candidatus Thiodiazotropha sp.]